MKYIILIFLLAIVSCNDAEDDEIYINDFPHRISEPPLLDNKGDTAFIIMTPAEGWRLHAAGTVVNKDSIALNVKMTHTLLLEEDWFSIKKEQEDVSSNRWLTAALLAPDCGVTPGQIIAALAEHNIEARHIWKPMHLQPVFRDCAFVKTAERSVAEDVFARGVCLPSDTKMTPEQQAQVCAVIRGLF